jgi:hypothetical protein
LATPDAILLVGLDERLVAGATIVVQGVLLVQPGTIVDGVALEARNHYL